MVTLPPLALAILLAQAAAPPAAGARPAAAPAPKATTARPVRPPAPADLSWEEADQLATTLVRIDRRLRGGRPASSRTLVVTERQLNSYLNLALAPKIPPSVSELRLQLLPNGFGARAMLDLDQVKGKVPSGAATSMLSLLSGTVPVELLGRVAAANGTGRVEVHEARVGGVSLPPALVAQLVSLSTRSEKQPQGLDMEAPFALPWRARQVRFEAGRLLVDFFQ